ncbi:MAG: DUF2949 domain-containing protein [Leptolyngbya sp. SIO4C1]|nr:DUF2949 domain-containing protein [Leptolyngbya sp. SIO4C1]
MIPQNYGKLVSFLKDELLIAPTSIETALRHCEQDPGPLPMVLWQYGFVSLKQLEQIYDWLETV